MPTAVFVNRIDSFLFEEMRERLSQGLVVRIAFGGKSMMPMLHGEDDKVMLESVDPKQPCRCGECYLFAYRGQYVLHRLLSAKGDMCTFRGDNCRNKEIVPRTALVAKLRAVERDGRVVSCKSFSWRIRSFFAVLWRSVVNMVAGLLCQRGRVRIAPFYFLALAVLMWAPLNGVGLQLNNYMFGIRLDHLLHASVYIPCSWFLYDVLKQSRWKSWLCATAVGLLTESVQYLLPYRGFDVNDLVANAVGVVLGLGLFVAVVGKGRR